ncbi:hypothetical protein J2TS4_27770 [Paenibacillus sp. J2TS4]|nr:hypothetical protein J2TS4_27770 [Paenibacillus sp. J2TS4]
MSTFGAGTVWPFELLVYFCEEAVQFIQEEGDIFEDMGDCFTNAYEEVIQILNKEKTPLPVDGSNRSGCENGFERPGI